MLLAYAALSFVAAGEPVPFERIFELLPAAAPGR
jgi:hypothetical protein